MTASVSIGFLHASAVLAMLASSCFGQGIQFKAEYEDDDDLAGGIDGLQAVSSVALSPDGTSLYAIGTLEDSIAAFTRDPSTGLLTFVTAYFDNDSPSPHASGVNLGLDSTRDVAVSPDSRHVYATGLLDQAVGVFSRNASTNALTFVEAEADPVNLRGAFGIAISPDGAHVYVTTRTNDSITSFTRDIASGALSFLDVDKNLIGGVIGLDSAEGIAISPDGKHIYSAEFPFGLALLATEAPSYASWAACFPGLIDTDPNADPDFDGLTNLVEFALDLDPTRNDGTQNAAPRPLVEADRLVIEFGIPFPVRSDLLVEVLAASDIAVPQVIASKSGAGNWTGPSTVTESAPLNGITVRVTDIVTRAQAGDRFMWLRITQL